METSSTFDRFTTNLKMVFAKASAYAVAGGSLKIEPEHLVLGILSQRGSLGAEVLIKIGLKNDDNLRLFSNQPGIEPTLALSDLSKKAIEKAAFIAENYEHLYIGTEHLLAGLVKAAPRELENFFRSSGVSIKTLEQHLETVLKSTSKFSDLTSHFIERNPQEVRSAHPVKPKTPALEFFARELTNPEIQDELDPVIGRENEIERTIETLLRRRKNNPLLLGDPGVGKTAIVEGLAKKIVAGEVPDLLLSKKIYALDLGLVVAGTMYRGEFESRFKQILEEAREDEDAILFIDEIHMLIGAGSASGSMDAANLLKPALAKGEIKLIGATTLEEFKQHIETDAALERRLQPVMVYPPSESETEQILKGVRGSYEKYHKIEISDEAIMSAVALSKIYMPEKFFPDKAIDLIDETAARLKLKKGLSVALQTIKAIEKELEELREYKKQKVSEENYVEAIALKEQEKILIDEMANLKEIAMSEEGGFLGRIGQKDIYEAVSVLTKIPMGRIEAKEASKYLNLESLLRQKVVGQVEAVSLVAQAIKRSRAGLSSKNRPLGSFIFLGPSGVGKSETAKILAEMLFDESNSLIRIDMSEFAESFNTSKLIGAPAGYVGYREENKFTDQVKKRPYSVVLLDEIEKAHPTVFNLLLQILEDGEISDATGRRINFRNTIIIMTSNIGLDAFNKNASIGFAESIDKKDIPDFESARQSALNALKDKFRPEFLNRIDHIIVFKPLLKQSLIQIVKMELGKLNDRLEDKNIEIKFDPKSLEKVSEKSFHPEQGARGIRYYLQSVVEANLADQILNGKMSKGKGRKTVSLSSLI